MNISSKAIVLSLFLLLGSLVYATAPTDADPSAPGAIVAKVNDQTITVSELDAASVNALRGVTDPAIQVRIKTQILQDLINRSLVEQTLNGQNLDPNSDLARQVIQIKRQALINAYVNTRIGVMPPPNPKAVDVYVQEHPEFFEKRRMYHYSETAVEAGDNTTVASVQADLKVRGFEGLGDLLTSRQIKNASANYWQGADRMNPATYALIKDLKDGEVGVELSPNKKAILVVKNIASYPDPLSLKDARTLVANSMASQQRVERGQAILADLRTKATVQIMDAALAEQSKRNDLAVQTSARPSNPLAQVRLAWFFALLLLVPAALWVFYRRSSQLKKTLTNVALFTHKPTSQKISNKSMLHSALTELQVASLSVPFRLAVVAVMGFWLLLPVYGLMIEPPEGLGIRNLLVLAIAGLSFGAVAFLAVWKVPAINRYFTNRWMGIGLVLLIQRVCLSF